MYRVCSKAASFFPLMKPLDLPPSKDQQTGSMISSEGNLAQSERVAQFVCRTPQANKDSPPDCGGQTSMYNVPRCELVEMLDQTWTSLDKKL
jgi:hypothetical protein